MKLKPPSLFFGLLLATSHAEIITLANPDEPLPAKKTVVWSPLFQAAWDELNAKCGGPPDRVEPPNPLMAKLDSFQWDPAQVMPESSWKTWCGSATVDFLKQVNQEAAAITKEPTGPFTLPDERPESLAFFGILDREVDFLPAFFKSTKAPMEFRAADGVHPVRFFGVKDEFSGDFSDTVRVLAWRQVDRSHAIQVSCFGSDDTVVLYAPPKLQNFATACRWLRTWRKQPKPGEDRSGAWNDPVLHENDMVQIPYVALDAKADFKPLLAGLRYHRNNPLPWVINRAEQVTHFELHEKGARARVTASGGADPFGGPPPSTPRRFLFNRPFFIFLWREKAEWPYFGAWIGDASALKAFP